MEDTGKKWSSIGIAGVIILVLGVLFQRTPKPAMEYYNSGFQELMGTLVQVTVLAENRPRAQWYIDAAFVRMRQINHEMNDHDPNSPISQLSLTACQGPVAVSPELFEVIETSLHYSRLSDGAFDITIGPQTQLWRKMAQTGQKPTDQEIAAAKAKVGYEKLTLDKTNQTVKFAVEGMKLDVGAIAKGYAVDLAVKTLQDKGVTAGMIAIGGDIRCFGQGPGKNGAWLIGLQDPRHEEDILMKLRLNDMAVSTSGDYRRVIVIDREPYSHIINPKSAESVKELASVTVIGSKAIDTDAIDTTISVLGKEKGLAFLKQFDNVEAILIATQEPDKMIETSGVQRFIVKE